MARFSGLSIRKAGNRNRDFTLSRLQKTTLAASAKLAFRSTFKVKAKGKRSATSRIESHDADENPFDIKLTGVGASRIPGRFRGLTPSAGRATSAPDDFRSVTAR